MGNKEASVSSVELLLASFIDHSLFLCANVWWNGGVGGWTYVYLYHYMCFFGFVGLMFGLHSHFYIWSTLTVSQYVLPHGKRSLVQIVDKLACLRSKF